MTGVVSAAVVSGELIIGLSDGKIIRAGYVQGPTGKTGPEGAIGSTGPRGLDGNTILSGMEKPKLEDGREGDFYIWTREWYIYGPKTSGQWGTGTNMLAPKEYFKSSPNKSGGGGGSSPSSEGGTGTGSVFSNQVFLSGTGRAITAPGGNIIPEGLNLSVQSNLNKWIENSLRALDTKLPVEVVGELPDTGQYEGDLVLFDGSLYVWAGGAWAKVSADGGATIDTIPPIPAEEGQLWFNNSEEELTLYIYDGAAWVPASPPVSLDGINTAIANVDAELMKVNANIAMNKRDIDEAILDVQEDQTRQDGGIETNARDIIQLRSRVGDLEHGQGSGDFLPTAGGELKGTLEINGSRDKDGKINPLLCRADGYYMSFGVNKDGEVFAGSSEGQPFLASSSWHVVTKGYLDSQTSRHFGSPYRFRSHGIPTNLTEGEFTYDKDWNWYAHRYDAAGSRIGISKEDGYTHDGMFKVYRYNGSIHLICIMHRYDVCKTGQKNTNYFEWRKKESPYTHVEWLEESKLYYLSDGFLLPQ